MLYSFVPNGADSDGDNITFGVTNKPGWLVFDPIDGSLTGIPTLGEVGMYSNIQVEVTDGSMTASLRPFEIAVVMEVTDNTPPTISGTPAADVTVGQNFQFVPAASDPDGESVTFEIQNQPSWTTFDQASGALSGVPSIADTGTFENILISVSDGQTSTPLPVFSITVLRADNNPPTIGGAPSTAAVVASTYVFEPIANDADGDSLTFDILNLPTWANFDPDTGAISGTPAPADVGDYPGVRISVSDGQASTALAPFAIEVFPESVPGSAPTISGTPSTSVVVGSNYSFTPGATDADGDNLTFEILNPPVWAQFDPATGTLSGTPSASHIDTYSNIVISVSDGIFTTSLPPFSVTVTDAALGSITLFWDPPTTNTNGTPLVDLAGYRIYYGTQQNNLSEVIAVNNPGTSSYVIENLGPGTYFLASTAINSSGAESSRSNISQMTIN